MNVLVVGCSFRDAPIELRERLAFGPKLAAGLEELASRYGCEVAILSTCNRVELYLARSDAAALPDAERLAEFLSHFHDVALGDLQPVLYSPAGGAAVRHLFRVAASLDSMVVGEGQIVGQIKKTYESAQERMTAGPLLHALFQQALAVAKRVRTETGIARGHVSVSSVAVDYVRQVFEHFDDKTVLIIGAGKMGELTLKHLKELRPKHILVTNRSPEKAEAVAAGCGGQALPWENLDDGLVRADIVLSTTGAPEPIVSRRRYQALLGRRTKGTQVILDIAVPRDFDPRIHDGDRVCLFNIDDLKRIREQTLADRHKHVAAAEGIVEQEQRRFASNWARRRHAPVIARLTRELDQRRQVIVKQVWQRFVQRFNGQLTDADREYLEGAFRLLQNQFLHGPMSALAEEAHESGQQTLLDALRKMFRLEE